MSPSATAALCRFGTSWNAWAVPANPVVTLPRAIELLAVSKPTVIRAMAVLVRLGILREVTGKRRDRVYAYHDYLQVLTQDT